MAVLSIELVTNFEEFYLYKLLRVMYLIRRNYKILYINFKYTTQDHWIFTYYFICFCSTHLY